MGEAGDLSDGAAAGDEPGAADVGAGDAARVEPQPAGASPPARASARLSCEAVVRLRCDGRRGIHTGFMRDISRGGMFLRLVDPEPVGKRMGFELFLPGWRLPARGVGVVAWQRPRYEGPGRPPGMALRFVAMEAEGLAMLAEVLPGGEAPAVEVMERPRPQLLSRPRPPEVLPPAVAEPPLAQLVAAAGVHPWPAAALAAARGDEVPFEPTLSGLEDALSEPMIFVPPPPAAPPPAPAPPAMVPPLVSARGTEGEPAARPRWGSAAAGIAAIAGLATLVVVGAARREVVLPPTAAPAADAAPAAPPAALVPAPPAAAPVEAPAVAPAPKRPPATSDAGAPAAAFAVGAVAHRLAGLRWEPLAGGGTRVVITFDGPFEASRLRASRITGESPRLVVRLLGVGEGAPREPWEPAGLEVRRIRAGRHQAEGGAEIHLVLDLVGDGVRLARSEVAGGELRLDLVASP